MPRFLPLTLLAAALIAPPACSNGSPEELDALYERYGGGPTGTSTGMSSTGGTAGTTTGTLTDPNLVNGCYPSTTTEFPWSSVTERTAGIFGTHQAWLGYPSSDHVSVSGHAGYGIAATLVVEPAPASIATVTSAICPPGGLRIGTGEVSVRLFSDDGAFDESLSATLDWREPPGSHLNIPDLAKLQGKLKVSPLNEDDWVVDSLTLRVSPRSGTGCFWMDLTANLSAPSGAKTTTTVATSLHGITTCEPALSAGGGGGAGGTN